MYIYGSNNDYFHYRGEKKAFSNRQRSSDPWTSLYKPKVIIISFEEYDSLKETIEVLTEFPNLKKDMEETEKAIKTGEYKNWTTLEDLLGKEGFIFHDKSSNKYEVSNSTKTKSRKRT
ncbi:MAG: hypothetical protein UR23_C0041G0008 [Candidatus Roizmanbacteria bacterium GW2011_GWA2_32_13]|uniref:Antitoxin n=1 Tax=Candidatus Roizmanbacteria bacterium GW2011_GWA2_32_13 TaxID=1618475 RepID=A0A0F9YQH7_9BACT|nr:MAG: hypothetical protein UR23_C0041G0008 [Candidatus Roizmanbacteria bacterium GW2011_GWA2_32_13]